MGLFSGGYRFFNTILVRLGMCWVNSSLKTVPYCSSIPHRPSLTQYSNMLSISPRKIFSWTRLAQINCEDQPCGSYLNSSYWIFKWNKNLSLESESRNSRVSWQSILKLRRGQRYIARDVWNPKLLRTARRQNLVIFVFSNKLNIEAKEICRHWG